MSQTTTVGFDPGTQHLMPQLQGQVQQQQQQPLQGQGQYAQVQVQHEEVAPMSAAAAVRAALNGDGRGRGGTKYINLHNTKRIIRRRSSRCTIKLSPPMVVLNMT